MRLEFPSAGALPNPGTYTVTVRARVNVAVGTRKVCPELTSDGSSSFPDLEVYAIAARGSE